MAVTPIYKLSDPVSLLPNCGAKRAEALGKLGIFTVGELIRHFPRGYQNRGDVRLLSAAPFGENASYALTVGTQPTTVRLRGGKNVTKLRAFDESGSCTVVFFNQPYIKDSVNLGECFRFWGKAVKGRSGVELYPSAFERITEYRPLKGFFPLYPLSAGLTQKLVSGWIGIALDGIADASYQDVLPPDVASAFGVCSLKEAYRCIHFPESFSDIDRGRTRFMAEELFLFACSVSKNRESREVGTAPVMNMELSRFDGFLPHLPFTLTRAQSKVISDIRKDMLNKDGIPMARLISGDVGSGKTVCAEAAAYMALRNGWQCAFMVPTEILASQHYQEILPLFTAFGMKVELLTGSVTANEKRKVYALMNSGNPCLVIGTHALLSDGAEFARLGLVITDEQHRFGVMQRSALAARGAVNSGVSPHVLVMSATPIPRTLALILCGDLDVSVIDELPPGRQKVDTLVVGEEHRKRMYGFIVSQLDAGRQVYMVCPAVETKEEAEEEGADFLDFAYHASASPKTDDSTERFVGEQTVMSFDNGTVTQGNKVGPWSGALDGADKGAVKPRADRTENIKLKTAVEYAAQLKNEVFPDRSIEFIHGRMSGAEKDRIMRSFAAGKIDILVSTTVIEVGVNVPNASVMVVENAERFGLSQLHQLRGRVGRGQYKSYCILVSAAKGENAVRRLNVMKNVSNGYEIAKYDLDMRGPGDFMPSFGSARQHGEFKFKLAGLCNDTGMLQLAYAQAKDILSRDPELVRPEHSALRAELDRIFANGASALN